MASLSSAYIRNDFEKNLLFYIKGPTLSMPSYVNPFLQVDSPCSVRCAALLLPLQFFYAISEVRRLLEVKELLKSCLTKALTPQDLEIIADQCAGWGEYSSALKSMAHA